MAADLEVEVTARPTSNARLAALQQADKLARNKTHLRALGCAMPRVQRKGRRRGATNHGGSPRRAHFCLPVHAAPRCVVRMNDGPDEQQFHAEVMAELEQMQSDAEFWRGWINSIRVVRRIDSGRRNDMSLMASDSGGGDFAGPGQRLHRPEDRPRHAKTEVYRATGEKKIARSWLIGWNCLRGSPGRTDDPQR